MEYKLFNRMRERLRGPGKRIVIIGSVILIVLSYAVAAIIMNFTGDDKKYESPLSFTGLKNKFSFVILGHKPAFYYMEIEKNSKDFKLGANDAFDVSYRDEFVVKEISTDVFLSRGITVDFEGIGGADDFRVMLRGLELVDKTIMNRVKVADTEVVDAGSISVKYREEVIASIPMRVVITPQDWLRYAKNSGNQLSQIEYLKRAISMNKKDIGVRKMLAALYIRSGMIDKAINQYNEILILQPNDVPSLSELLKCYISAKNNNKAIKTGIKLLRLNPPDAEYAKSALAGVYLKSGNYDESIKLYKEIIATHPQNATAYANLGFAYGGKGQWKEEIDNYKKAISLNPRDPVAHFNLAVAFEKREQIQEAAKEYFSVLKINPGDTEAALRLADINFKNKKYKDAIELYEKIVKSSSHKAAIYTNLGFGYGELKKYKQSLECYEKAKKYGMKNPQMRHNLANAYDKLGGRKETIKQYEKIALSRPTMDVLDSLAAYYMNAKQYDNAIRTYKKMIVLNPRKASVYSSLGYVYGLKKNTEKEIEYYNLSLKYDSENDDVYFNLGDAYEKKGMFQEALNSYTHAYELNPGLDGAAKKIPALKIKILQQKHQES